MGFTIKMAPVIQDYDLSLSSHDDVVDQAKAINTPLHDTVISSPRSVSFGAMVSTYEVLSRNDYTYEEIEQSWFGRDDMRRMKESARSEAKLMESGLLVQSKDTSIRGLESRTRDGMRRKRQSRINAYAAVFLEIDCQDDEGYVDEELIADAYFVHSERCAMTAQMLGERDEKEAMEILQNQNAEFFGRSFCETITDLSMRSVASSAA